MAEGTSNLGLRLTVDQILAEAQHRWLKSVEIAEVLRSHSEFVISSEAPNRPDNGSVYLFNRKTLKFFRKDGHSWRKAANGSAVQEGHEKLKVGTVQTLQCYYAHSAEYEYFQRRSYWLLEQEHTHIVFVHYLEAMVTAQNVGGHILYFSTFAPGKLHNKRTQSSSRNNDTVVPAPNPHVNLTSPRSTLPSSHGDAGSGDNIDPSPTDSMTWEMAAGLASIQEAHEDDTAGEMAYQQEPGFSVPEQDMLQNYLEECLQHCIPTNQNPVSNLPNEHGGNLFEEEPILHPNQETLVDPSHPVSNEQFEQGIMLLSNEVAGNAMDDDISITLDSLPEDTDTLNPQSQMFSSIEFSPKWAYEDVETKVMVAGDFLRCQPELSNCRFSVMFDQVEVVAEVLVEGVLYCRAPPHEAGRVTLCVTRSDGLACSEIREFEYRPRTQHMYMGGGDDRGDAEANMIF